MTTAIDLFAGSGGFSTGARMAGVDVLWAANHWPAAVDCHAQNHPEAEHVCQDLHQADWTKVPSTDLVLASPCCQGHTRARGKDRPHHDASRSTAWAAVSCVEYHRPKALIVENVPEFRQWALYPAWVMALESLGYQLTENVLDAADTGCPQNRVRLFIVAARKRIEIPQPERPHTPARKVVDFSRGRWSAVNKPGRAESTLLRIQNGRRNLGDRFLISYYGSSKTGRSLDRPLGTVTTRDRWGVVDGDRMRMLTVEEYRDAMGFPSDYRLPKNRALAIHLLGNAVPPPLAAYVVQHATSQL